MSNENEPTAPYETHETRLAEVRSRLLDRRVRVRGDYPLLAPLEGAVGTVIGVEWSGDLQTPTARVLLVTGPSVVAEVAAASLDDEGPDYVATYWRARMETTENELRAYAEKLEETLQAVQDALAVGLKRAGLHLL